MLQNAVFVVCWKVNVPCQLQSLTNESEQTKEPSYCTLYGTDRYLIVVDSFAVVKALPSERFHSRLHFRVVLILLQSKVARTVGHRKKLPTPLWGYIRYSVTGRT